MSFSVCVLSIGDGAELYGMNTMAIMKQEIMNIINICRDRTQLII